MVAAKARGPGKVSAGGIADDFERASLGADWSRAQGDVVIANSVAVGAGSLSGIHVATWVGTTLADDQFAEVQVAADIQAVEHMPCARRRSSDLARYGLAYNEDGAGSPRWILKFDGVPAQDTRTWATAYTTPLAAGDVMRIEARGQSPVRLRGYHNSRLVIEAEDTAADRILTGPPAVAFRARSGFTLTYPSPVYSRFAAGSLVGG